MSKWNYFRWGGGGGVCTYHSSVNGSFRLNPEILLGKVCYGCVYVWRTVGRIALHWLIYECGVELNFLITNVSISWL